MRYNPSMITKSPVSVQLLRPGLGKAALGFDPVLVLAQAYEKPVIGPAKQEGRSDA